MPAEHASLFVVASYFLAARELPNNCDDDYFPSAILINRVDCVTARDFGGAPLNSRGASPRLSRQSSDARDSSALIVLKKKRSPAARPDVSQIPKRSSRVDGAGSRVIVPSPAYWSCDLHNVPVHSAPAAKHVEP